MHAGSGIHWQKPASYFGAVFMGQFGLCSMMQDEACELPCLACDFAHACKQKPAGRGHQHALRAIN